jgi:copper chaperone CopZ
MIDSALEELSGVETVDVDPDADGANGKTDLDDLTDEDDGEAVSDTA